MSINDGILDFGGRSHVRSPFYESLDPWFFFSSKIFERSDKVAQNPYFLLIADNNDLKQKDKS